MVCANNQPAPRGPRAPPDDKDSPRRCLTLSGPRARLGNVAEPSREVVGLRPPTRGRVVLRGGEPHALRSCHLVAARPPGGGTGQRRGARRNRGRPLGALRRVGTAEHTESTDITNDGPRNPVDDADASTPEPSDPTDGHDRNGAAATSSPTAAPAPPAGGSPGGFPADQATKSEAANMTTTDTDGTSPTNGDRTGSADGTNGAVDAVHG